MHPQNNIKKMVFEPKLYTVLVRSSKGQALHLGVHFTLEEAYAAARTKLIELTPHANGEPMDIELWNSLSANECIQNLSMDGNSSFSNQVVEEDSILQDIQNIFGPRMGPSLGGGVRRIHVERIDQLPNEINKIIEEIKNNKNAPVPMAAKRLTVGDHMKKVKDAKNELMKTIIETGDVEAVEKMGRALTSYERKLVLQKIEDRQQLISKKPPEIKG